MKVSVAPLAPPMPPDTGASIEPMPCFAASACALLGALDVDGRAVDDQRALRPSTERPSVQTDSTCLPAGSMVMTTSAPFTARHGAVGDPCPVGLGLRARRLDQIERGHLVAGLDQIGRHRPAHIAETDECDACHLKFPPLEPLPVLLVEHEFVGADRGEVGATICGRHIFECAAATISASGPCRSRRRARLRENRRWRTLRALRDIPAPGILPARSTPAPAAAVSAPPPCCAATFRSTSSSVALRQLRAVRPQRRDDDPASRSWPNHAIDLRLDRRDRSRVSPVAKPSITASDFRSRRAGPQFRQRLAQRRPVCPTGPSSRQSRHRPHRGPIHGLAGQPEISADLARRARQQPGAADIRKEADADFRHRQLGPSR